MKDALLTLQFLLVSLVCFCFALYTGLRGFALPSVGFGILSVFAGTAAIDTIVQPQNWKEKDEF